MIQIDMPMPTNCLDCPACNEYLMCAIPIKGRGWGENDVREFGQGRPEWCPMKEQEAVERTSRTVINDFSIIWTCGICGSDLHPNNAKAKFCSNCGQAVKWNE